MADNKPKKGLYHSEAVQISPIKCTVKSDVLRSKYEGKPDYVILFIDGNERNYAIENPDCAAALKGMKNKNTMLEFTGSRDDASIRVLGAGATQQQPPIAADPGPEPNEPPDFRNQPQQQRTPAPRQEPLPAAEQEAARMAAMRERARKLRELREAHAAAGEAR